MYVFFIVVVPVSEVHREGFCGSGQCRIHCAADHYGIYRDLFGDAYFYPQFLLGVGYKVEGEECMVNPVFHGNCLTPTEVGSLGVNAKRFYLLLNSFAFRTLLLSTQGLSCDI